MTSPRLTYNRLIHQGNVVEFRQVGLRTPGGKVIPRDLVHYNGAVVILPILDDGRVVMVRNYRYAIDCELLELPAGMIESGEPPEQAAPRELLEETGYTAERFEPLGRFYPGPGTTDECLHAFLATGLAPGPQQLEEYEDIAVTVQSQEQLRRQIAAGQMRHGKTLAVMNLYWLKEQTS